MKEAFMKRAKTGSLTAKWEKVSSKRRAKAIEPKLPKKQDGNEPNGLSLALVKKTPVTFRLSSAENPKDFELMSFVIKACDKNGAEPFMTVLHVKQTRRGSRLVACDGIRLHVAEISKKIKSGDYKPHATKEAITLGEPEKDINYPDLVKNIPERAQKRGIINLDKTGMGRDREETEKLSVAFNSIVKQTGETVNLRYLDDLPKTDWAVYSRNGGRNKILILRPKSRKPGEAESKYPVAVIMPIKQAA
jgi:hypothetical protein